MNASADIEQLRDLQDYEPPLRPWRVYIAGPMGGLPEFNYPAFHAAAQMLRGIGVEVINPAEADLFFGPPGNVPRETYLRYAMTNVGMCDAIYLLPGWQQSGGALLELHLALELGLAVINKVDPDLNLMHLDPRRYEFKLVETGTGEVMQRGPDPLQRHITRALGGVVAGLRDRLPG